jgi:hypothetical protein
LAALTRWYRAYEGTVTDAKLGEVALVAGCSRSVAIAAWHCILESACTSNDGGRFKATSRNVAVTLQEQVATVDAVFKELENLEMIKNGYVVAWSRRQYQSDSSTERSRKHRENKVATRRNVAATLQQRCATAPDTDTDTEVEEKNNLTVVPKETAKAKRGTRLQDDFEPDASCHDLAEKLLLSRGEGQKALDNFLDYWRSVPGAKGLKLDWQATFRNQLRHVAASRKTTHDRSKSNTIADGFALVDAALARKREELGEVDPPEISGLRKIPA